MVHVVDTTLEQELEEMAATSNDNGHEMSASGIDK